MKYLLIPIISFILIYAMFSFVEMTANAGEWDKFVRFSYLLVSGICSLFCTWIKLDINHQKTK